MCLSCWEMCVHWARVSWDQAVLPLQPRWSPGPGASLTAPAAPAPGPGCARNKGMPRAGLQLGVPKSCPKENGMNVRRNADQSGEEDSGVLVLCPLALLSTEGPRALPSLPGEPA